jgi:hypothetical protein
MSSYKALVLYSYLVISVFATPNLLGLSKNVDLSAQNVSVNVTERDIVKPVSISLQPFAHGVHYHDLHPRVLRVDHPDSEGFHGALPVDISATSSGQTPPIRCVSRSKLYCEQNCECTPEAQLSCALSVKQQAESVQFTALTSHAERLATLMRDHCSPICSCMNRNGSYYFVEKSREVQGTLLENTASQPRHSLVWPHVAAAFDSQPGEAAADAKSFTTYQADTQYTAAPIPSSETSGTTDFEVGDQSNAAFLSAPPSSSLKRRDSTAQDVIANELSHEKRAQIPRIRRPPKIKPTRCSGLNKVICETKCWCRADLTVGCKQTGKDRQISHRLPPPGTVGSYTVHASQLLSECRLDCGCADDRDNENVMRQLADNVVKGPEAAAHPNASGRHHEILSRSGRSNTPEHDEHLILPASEPSHLVRRGGVASSHTYHQLAGISPFGSQVPGQSQAPQRRNPLICQGSKKSFCESDCLCDARGKLMCKKLRENFGEISKLGGAFYEQHEKSTEQYCSPVCGCQDETGRFRFGGKTAEEWETYMSEQKELKASATKSAPFAASPISGNRRKSEKGSHRTPEDESIEALYQHSSYIPPPYIPHKVRSLLRRGAGKAPHGRVCSGHGKKLVGCSRSEHDLGIDPGFAKWFRGSLAVKDGEPIAAPYSTNPTPIGRKNLDQWEDFLEASRKSAVPMGLRHESTKGAVTSVNFPQGPFSPKFRHRTSSPLGFIRGSPRGPVGPLVKRGGTLSVPGTSAIKPIRCSGSRSLHCKQRCQCTASGNVECNEVYRPGQSSWMRGSMAMSGENSNRAFMEQDTRVTTECTPNCGCEVDGIYRTGGRNDVYPPGGRDEASLPWALRTGRTAMRNNKWSSFRRGWNSADPGNPRFPLTDSNSEAPLQRRAGMPGLSPLTQSVDQHIFVRSDGNSSISATSSSPSASNSSSLIGTESKYPLQQRADPADSYPATQASSFTVHNLLSGENAVRECREKHHLSWHSASHSCRSPPSDKTLSISTSSSDISIPSTNLSIDPEPKISHQRRSNQADSSPSSQSSNFNTETQFRAENEDQPSNIDPPPNQVQVSPSIVVLVCGQVSSVRRIWCEARCYCTATEPSIVRCDQAHHLYQAQVELQCLHICQCEAGSTARDSSQIRNAARQSAFHAPLLTRSEAIPPESKARKVPRTFDASSHPVSHQLQSGHFENLLSINAFSVAPSTSSPAKPLLHKVLKRSPTNSQDSEHEHFAPQSLTPSRPRPGRLDCTRTSEVHQRICESGCYCSAEGEDLPPTLRCIRRQPHFLDDYLARMAHIIERNTMYYRLTMVVNDDGDYYPLCSRSCQCVEEHHADPK